jgi:gliding motility-associated-like protein
LFAGADQTLNCSTTCTKLQADFPDIRATTTYIAESIPHNPPIAYNEPNGTAINVSADDRWSKKINLPFSFCFYGNDYDALLIGTNGNISFDLSREESTCPYKSTEQLPSTNKLGALTTPGNIFGVYHDLTPRVCGQVNYYSIGNQPNRKFIISYNEVCQFSCTTLKSTQMIVLYETTNIIDVYVKSKPTCSWNDKSAWNDGNAIIGIQNMDGSEGIAAPGRNNVTPIEYDANKDWTITTPEAWRFKPNGIALYEFAWFQGSTKIGSTNDINICPAETSTYTAKLKYTPCGSTTPINVTDNVTITLASQTLNATFDNVKNVSCFGLSDGATTIKAIGGTQPYSFRVNSAIKQSTGTFNNLKSGDYLFEVADAGGCTILLDTTITQPIELNLALLDLDTASCDLANGALTLKANGGVGTLIYSINDFISQQSSGIFDSLYPKKYLAKVLDNKGCFDTLTVFVPAISSVQLNLSHSKNISCHGINDGEISVSGSNGMLPYSYQLNNGVTQKSPFFSMLESGNYKVFISDSLGCKDSIEAIIQEPTPISLTVTKPPAACLGDSIVLNAIATGGIPPFSYLWNGTIIGDTLIDYPTNNQTYTLFVKDSNGCSKQEQVEVIISTIPQVNFSVSPKTGFESISVIISNQSINANLYEWDFGNGQMLTSFDLSPINIIYSEPGLYFIKLLASNDFCKQSRMDSILVLSLQELKVEVPNVFSPNGDDINEGYSLIVSNAKSIEAFIIDRWGNKIFEITDLNSKWDGKNPAGADAMEGVYFIKYKVIGFDNQRKDGHSFFHLKR